MGNSLCAISLKIRKIPSYPLRGQTQATWPVLTTATTTPNTITFIQFNVCDYCSTSSICNELMPQPYILPSSDTTVSFPNIKCFSLFVDAWKLSKAKGLNPLLTVHLSQSLQSLWSRSPIKSKTDSNRRSTSDSSFVEQIWCSTTRHPKPSHCKVFVTNEWPEIRNHNIIMIWWVGYNMKRSESITLHHSYVSTPTIEWQYPTILTITEYTGSERVFQIATWFFSSMRDKGGWVPAVGDKLQPDI